MIAKMRGTLVTVQNGRAFLDIHDVTYEILISRAVEERLIVTEKIGQEVTFHIMHYIEGALAVGNLTPRLVGFLNETDLEFFSLLITVQGLGVKKALRSLVIPVRDVARAIELNDTGILRKLPEIGSKTAQKIVVELKGKAAKFALLREEELPRHERVQVFEHEYMTEAVEVLKQLQYSEAEARDIVARTAESRPDITSTEELIQEIFKKQVH